MWTPDPAKIITAQQKVELQRASILMAYKNAFDAHLDQVAKERQYDNRHTIVGYRYSTHSQWAAEAESFIAWRDACMMEMFVQLAAVEAGDPRPSIEDFIAGLPTIDWPD